MTASIVRNAAVTVISEEEHLIFPIIAVEGPAVGEDDRFTCWVSPIFIEDLGRVFGSDERHVDVAIGGRGKLCGCFSKRFEKEIK